MISASSCPDPKARHAINSRRIQRKPPPPIDVAERYPSPDPLDPFAPLWVLRNRTHSALPGPAARAPLPPYSDPYGSQDTLNNLAERTRSNSCLDSSPTSSAATHGKSEANSCMVFSPPDSPTRLKPKPKANAKRSHYTPYSQMNVVGTLQAFPRTSTPQASQTHIDLASPGQQQPGLPKNHGQSPQFRNDADLTDSAGSGTDTDDDDDDDASIMSSLKIASPRITHPHLQQPLDHIPIISDTRPSLPAAHSPSPVPKPKSHNRFASFFLPKKTSFLIGDGGGRTSPTLRESGTTGGRSSAFEFRRVSKSMISAPRAVQSTVIWDPKNNAHRGRVPTPITRTGKATTNDGQTSSSLSFQSLMGKSSPLDAKRGTSLENRPKNSNSKFSQTHSGVLNPLTIKRLTDKPDFHADRHSRISEQRCSSNRQFLSMEKAKKKHCAPILRSLSVPIPKSFTGNKKQEPQIRGRSRMTSVPPLSPVQPSMHSISNTSIVEVSISTPSFASNPSDEEVGKYTRPRPAPQPPLHGPTTTEKGDKRHSESNCCSTSSDATFPSASTSTHPIPIPVLSSFPTEWAIPTPTQITQTASLLVTREDGTRVSFGSLFATTRTIVVFIRHFWCPLCQDYMSSLKSLVRPEMLSAGDDNDADLKTRLVSFVVISNGAHGMIHKYKQIFGLPFEVYTDPSLAIYKALGMGRDGDDHGHAHQHHSRIQQQQAQCNQRRQEQVEEQVSVSGSPSAGKDGEKGSGPEERKFGGYVKHGLMSGIAMVVVRAIKVGMPVWEKGGDIGQLGGEFIFGPGLTCSFAHRMQTTKGHAPIEDVLAAAGVDVNAFNRPSFDEEQYRHATPAPGSLTDNVLNHHFPPPTPPPSTNPLRRRLSSLKSLKESLPRSRATSTSSRFQVPVTVSFSTGEGAVDEGVSKRNTRRFSMGMFAGMMSREEEENWMEQRQLSIERLREKKNIRRGMMGRAVSSQSYRAQVLEVEVLEASGEPVPVKDNGKPQWPSTQKSYWEPMSELEVVGKMGDVEEEEPDEELDLTMVAPARMSFESVTDTASSYSTPSAMAMPPDGGNYIFMDTDDGAS